jgi:effector-binding domain-containing protein
VSDFAVIDLAPQHGAGIETTTSRAGLTKAIQTYFDRLYASGALLPGHGHNFILYRAATGADLRLTVGVLDRAPGEADADVAAVHVPGGRAITATHWGDYGGLRVTYDALHAEVRARGLKLAPLSLEIYGDWSNDPAKVRTDIYLYLALGI